MINNDDAMLKDNNTSRTIGGTGSTNSMIVPNNAAATNRSARPKSWLENVVAGAGTAAGMKIG
jgi:hypothetical protein